MVRRLMIALLLTSVCEVALADDSLVGTWMVSQITCSSGAVFYANSGIVSTQRASMTFSKTDITIKMTATTQINQAYAADLIKDAQETLKDDQALADGTEKQKRIADHKKDLANLQKYAAGVTCNSKSKMTYTFDGWVMKTSKLETVTTDCPEDANDDTGNEYMIDLKGYNLKLTDLKPETKPGSGCPVGDGIITTLIRTSF